MQSFSSSAGIPGSMQPCCAPLALKPLYFFLDPFRSFRIDCIFVELYLQSNLEMNHWNSDIFKVPELGLESVSPPFIILILETPTTVPRRRRKM
ncbi:hypothetical protein Y1Q_0006195 [Alligator mississippiensis]|uniref:Uncharacterized protein n=1 Tax=Alligator mississippiensis TaxID=8496 RepID=A0A151NXA2_ALLMI|nr:hypothetical protein Y1Q_0006195 [Alligator mississippiensis]